MYQRKNLFTLPFWHCTLMHMRVYTHEYIHACTNTCKVLHTWFHAHNTCTHTYIHSSVHAYVETDIHTCIHTLHTYIYVVVVYDSRQRDLAQFINGLVCALLWNAMWCYVSLDWYCTADFSNVSFTTVVHNLFQPRATKRSLKPFGGQTGLAT